jgi:phospholipase C
VSPFARRAYVSHTPIDQTSVLRFIQTRFDLPALTRRDANADPLLEMFDFDGPPFRRPPKLQKAVIDPKRAAECADGGAGAPTRSSRRVPTLLAAPGAVDLKVP